jgi:hypothetical protein
MVHRIQGTITSTDNGIAALQLEDGQVLTIPLRDLQPKPQVGDAYTLTLLPEAQAKLATDELARALLSELITDVPPANQTTQGKGDQAGA